MIDAAVNVFGYVVLMPMAIVLFGSAMVWFLGIMGHIWWEVMSAPLKCYLQYKQEQEAKTKPEPNWKVVGFRQPLKLLEQKIRQLDKLGHDKEI